MRAKPETRYRLAFKFALVVPIYALGFQASGQAEAQRADRVKAPQTTFAQEIAAAKREGIPVSAKELQAPLPPPEQNAAPIYAQLTQLLKTKPLRKEDSVAENGVPRIILPPAQQMEQIRRALTNRKDVLDLIHKAASCPQCVTVRDWSKHPAVMAADTFPEYARFRSVARWLVTETALRLYDGKPLEAVRTQALGFQVAQHAASDPTLISHLVGVACDAITLGNMRRILYLAGEKPEVAEAVRQAIETHRKPLSLAYAMRDEVMALIVNVEMAHKEAPNALKQALNDADIPPAAKAKLPKDRKSLEQLMDASAATALHSLRTIIRTSDLPFPQAIAVKRTILKETEQKPDDPLAALSGVMLPVFEQATKKRAESQAKAETVRAAAALLAWKAKHGAFPTMLQEAMKSVPADPFVPANPLRYRREGKGFVVYSVGETGKFDGGTPAVRPKTQESLFRYPLPQYAK